VSEFGECRECVTRKKDQSEKELHQCSYCGISFCVEHFEPKPAFIPDFGLYSKYPEIWKAIEEEIKVEGKHPCIQFTDHWFEEKDRELKLQRKLLMEWLDKSKAYRRIPMKEGPMKKLKLGDCPFCFSSNSKTLAYNEKTMTFQCNRCGHEWAQEKAFPYRIIEKEEISDISKAETGKVRKIVVGIVVGFLKVLAFSIFTIATMLPTILYLVMMTLPEYQSTLALLYVFRPDFIFWRIVSNLGYLIAWVVVVYKVLRKRGKWWYYLILLGFGLWNWWTLLRDIWWFELFKGLFKAIGA